MFRHCRLPLLRAGSGRGRPFVVVVIVVVTRGILLPEGRVRSPLSRAEGLASMITRTS